MSCSSCLVAAPYGSSLYFYFAAALYTCWHGPEVGDPDGTGRLFVGVLGQVIHKLVLSSVDRWPKVGDPDGTGLLFSFFLPPAAGWLVSFYVFLFF